ncbi:hypothetical protein A7O68_15020, partial [Listeria monocytogenes]
KRPGKPTPGGVHPLASATEHAAGASENSNDYHAQVAAPPGPSSFPRISMPCAAPSARTPLPRAARPC